jgi:hypothetical protein
MQSIFWNLAISIAVVKINGFQRNIEQNIIYKATSNSSECSAAQAINIRKYILPQATLPSE